MITNSCLYNDRLIDKKDMCVFYNKSCHFGHQNGTEASKPEDRAETIPYKNIIRCLTCPVLMNNISNNSKIFNFLNILKEFFTILQKKIDLDEMILKKQRFSLDSIEKASEGLYKDQIKQEGILRNKINRYESLLSQKDIYLQTLQKLSDVIGQTSESAKIWKSASHILIHEIFDLQAVGLIILRGKDTTIERLYSSLLDQKLLDLIIDGIEKRGFCTHLMGNEIYTNLYQIFWRGNDTHKRPGPRIEGMLERCFLFPVKDHQSVIGIFIVLMKSLKLSKRDYSPFFHTAARLIQEGIIGKAYNT